MNTDWQSWAAFALVLLTAAFFLRSILQKKKKPGCDSCGTHSSRKL
jgi:hypothetical protein